MAFLESGSRPFVEYVWTDNYSIICCVWICGSMFFKWAPTKNHTNIILAHCSDQRGAITSNLDRCALMLGFLVVLVGDGPQNKGFGHSFRSPSSIIWFWTCLCSLCCRWSLSSTNCLILIMGLIISDCSISCTSCIFFHSQQAFHWMGAALWCASLVKLLDLAQIWFVVPICSFRSWPGGETLLMWSGCRHELLLVLTLHAMWGVGWGLLPVVCNKCVPGELHQSYK